MQEGYSTRRSDLAGSSYNLNRNSKGLCCKFHPTNNLHTFCISPQCMLPMCSACISIHNEDHYQQKTYGSFRDLQQLIRETVETIEQQQLVLEELSNQYVGDYNQKIKIPDKCKQILVKARAKAHEELDRVFDRFSIDIQQKIDNYSEKLHEIYNSIEDRIHNFHKVLEKQKNQLGYYENYNGKKILTKRSNEASFVGNILPSNQMSRNMENNQERKQERKILKTLIQFQSKNQKSVYEQKLVKLKQQIKQIKQINFQIQFDYMQMAKLITNVCHACLNYRNSFQVSENLKKKQIRFAKSDIIDSTTSIVQPEIKPEGERSKPTNERLKKINEQTINNGHPSNKVIKMNNFWS